jgi:HAD superfamily hydrolase (TIGR01544 family)
MEKHSVNEIFKHFKAKDKDKVLRKIEKLIADGKTNLHLLVDFDRTLTIGKDNYGRDFTSWNALVKLLPPKAMARHKALYDQYRSIEISGKMTDKDSTDWVKSVLQIFVENKINLSKLKEKVSEDICIRPHTKTVFDFCKNLGIPIVILSAGVKQTIEVWSKIYIVSPALTIATSLITDHNGTVIDWDKNIIYVKNKKEHGHKELSKISKNRSNVILIGDAIEDADMTDGDENVLRIRIYNPREDEAVSEKDYAKKTFEKFDLLIENQTLEPILKILELIK